MVNLLWGGKFMLGTVPMKQHADMASTELESSSASVESIAYRNRVFTPRTPPRGHRISETQFLTPCPPPNLENMFPHNLGWYLFP